MKIRLGYVAIAKTLDDISYNHTMTFTHYEKLEKKERNQKLDRIMKENLTNLLLVLKYNVQNKIFFFRFSHNLVPLATHDKVDFDYITPYQKEWKKIGDYIKKHNMRIDSHPDQYCVLNSTNPKTIENSIEMLKFQYTLYKAMNIEGFVVLHIGSSAPDKKTAMQKFCDTINKLPVYLKKMILLENDDKTFTVSETLELCEKLQIPMVLDYHHYICNPGKDNLNHLLKRILDTWQNIPYPPKMHFSSPKNRKEKRAHHLVIDAHKFIKFLTLLKPFETDIDIMLECKGKDESLFRLSRQLRFYTNYKFETPTSFIIK